MVHLTRQLPRRERRAQVVAAARAAFERDGVHETSIDRIAAEAGVSKALMFKLFASREELLSEVVITYADELAGRIAGRDLDAMPVLDRVAAALDEFCRLCAERPAYMDLMLVLMREPAGKLADRAGPAAILHLGQAMASLIGPLSAWLAELADEGLPGVPHPDLAANSLYHQGLGAMFAVRHGVGVREAAPGLPAQFPIEADQVREDFVATVRSALEHGVLGRGCAS